jgi:hypothetical protein
METLWTAGHGGIAKEIRKVEKDGDYYIFTTVDGGKSSMHWVKAVEAMKIVLEREDYAVVPQFTKPRSERC